MEVQNLVDVKVIDPDYLPEDLINPTAAMTDIQTSGWYILQSTLVISNSIISNNRLSRRENLVLVLTQKSKIRLQNIVEKRRNCSWGAISPLFHNIFNIYF